MLNNWVLFFCMLCTGVIFLTGLLTGVWKWQHMLKSASHQAPAYVDIAHRSALLYSFAGLLVWHFVSWSAWPLWLNFIGALLLFIFFISAIATYIILGMRNQTDNQFEQRTMSTTTGMILLLIAEIGGFLILFSGAIVGYVQTI